MALRTPRGWFQETIRTLADAAMTVTHHDIGETEPEYVSEMQQLERRFTNILRGKLLDPKSRTAKASDQP